MTIFQPALSLIILDIGTILQISMRDSNVGYYSHIVGTLCLLAFTRLVNKQFLENFILRYRK